MGHFAASGEEIYSFEVMAVLKYPCFLVPRRRRELDLVIHPRSFVRPFVRPHFSQKLRLGIF